MEVSQPTVKERMSSEKRMVVKGREKDHQRMSKDHDRQERLSVDEAKKGN